MSPDVFEAEAIVEVWIGALRQAYRLAYQTRLRELRGQRNRTFDSRGLEPYSEQMGRAWALQAVVPDLAGLFIDHHLIRAEARADAVQTFREELIRGPDNGGADGGAAGHPGGVAEERPHDG